MSNSLYDWLIVGQAVVIVALCGVGVRIAKVSVDRLQLLEQERASKQRLQAERDTEERARKALQAQLLRNTGAMRVEWAERARERNERGYTKRGFCVVCLASTGAIYASVPCGHACMCEECAQAVRASNSCCPFCRHRSSNFIRIYEAKGEEEQENGAAAAAADEQPQRRKERKSLRHRFFSLFR